MIFLQKHPHGRGEDRTYDKQDGTKGETPPRAWGRQLNGYINPAAIGNTPTGVGKTDAQKFANAEVQKHPHGRGEDVPRDTFHQPLLETPPRAWGRLLV